MDEPLAERILGLSSKTRSSVACKGIAGRLDSGYPASDCAPGRHRALAVPRGHQPELLNRLKINVRLKEDLARVLESIERN